MAPRSRTSRARTAQKKTKRAQTAHVVATRPVRTPLPKESLKVRRARARRLFYSVLAVIVVISIGTIMYLAWLPALRIHEVSAEGPAQEDVAAIARETLAGRHAFIVPRDSMFFVPESDIRKRILAAHPEIAAVSFRDAGLTGLHIVAVPRVSAFVWCGESKESAVSPCYDTDPDGLIFAPYTGEVAVASSTLHLRMYAPIDGDAANPVRAHIKSTYAIPNALQLARALKSLNANIAELALRGDEADFYTSGGTRITYVIGRERKAAGLAASAFPTLKLNDGSIEYVDLRFDAKVYLRRAGGGE